MLSWVFDGVSGAVFGSLVAFLMICRHKRLRLAASILDKFLSQKVEFMDKSILYSIENNLITCYFAKENYQLCIKTAYSLISKIEVPVSLSHFQASWSAIRG